MLLTSRAVRQAVRLCSSSSSHLCLKEIRKQLNEFGGGKVTLSSAGKADDIAVISASNPHRKNAFTGSMCVSLYDVIQELSTDRSRKAVILRGLDGSFCSGADLTMAKHIADPVNGEKFSYLMQTTLSGLRKLPFPSYAVLQGNVLGGGVELCLACDFVMATSNTNLYFVQGRMGIVPGWAGATHLVRKVGYHTALKLLLSGERVTSGYANSIGLIDTLVEKPVNNGVSLLSDDELLASSVDVIDKQLGRLSVEVVQGLKSVTLRATELDYEQSIAHERQVFKTLWGASANMAALNSQIKHA